MSTDRQSVTINPSNVPAPQPQFSQVNTINLSGPAKLIAITGQLAIPMDPNKPPPPGFEDQVKDALKYLENCLHAAGARKRDIFKVTHHIVDFDPTRAKQVTIIFCDWLDAEEDAKGFRPASAMLPAHKLADEKLFYEIETWAVVQQ